MAKRKGISQKRRFEVFKRDRFTCQYCGRTPPDVVLALDHIVPVASGGDNSEINLTTACFDCNIGKSDRSLDQVRPSTVEQIAEMKERRKQLESFNQFLLEERACEDAVIDQLGSHWYDQFCRKGRYLFGTKRIPSIRTFLKFLAPAEIMEAMVIAIGRVGATPRDDISAWKYFCGVCWRKIKKDGQYD